MSRFRDRLVPIVAGGLVVVVAISVVLLLRVANNQGIDALTQAKLQQVQATADSFNARVVVVAHVGCRTRQRAVAAHAEQQGRPEGAPDLQRRPERASPASSSSTRNDVVTDRRPAAAGQARQHVRPARLGAGEAQLATQAGGRAAGDRTTGSRPSCPSYDLVVAIRGASPTSVRGALVFEDGAHGDIVVRAGDRAARRPIRVERGVVLHRQPRHGRRDDADTGLGEPVENPRYLTDPDRVGLPRQRHRHHRRRPVARLARRLPRGPLAVRERRHRPAAAGRPDPGPAAARRRADAGRDPVRRLREAREQERRLRELTRSQAEFISVVSHELRTPVAGVLGFLQTTVDHWDTLSDDDRLDTVRRAVTNARRLQAMTRDVLDTESIESGRIGYSFQRVDLGTELQTAVEASRDADPSRLITLEPPSVPITIDADPDRLQQVLSNLLENARKNSPVNEADHGRDRHRPGPDGVGRACGSR